MLSSVGTRSNSPPDEPKLGCSSLPEIAVSHGEGQACFLAGVSQAGSSSISFLPGRDPV
jgi:hypothetical protein